VFYIIKPDREPSAPINPILEIRDFRLRSR